MPGIVEIIILLFVLATAIIPPLLLGLWLVAWLRDKADDGRR